MTISVKNSLSVTATDAAGNVSEATPVEVVFGPEPGKPAKLSFALAVDGGTIHAGDTVSYTYSVTDAYGGPVVNPLEVIPSWPQAVVFDDGISGNGQILGMTRTGDFTITARATGAAGVVQVAPLTVLPASGKRFIDLALTLSRMATNDTTAALTVVKDLYGNVIIDDANGTSAGLTLTCTPQNTATPATACSKAGNLFTVTKSGVYKITAAYDDGVNPRPRRLGLRLRGGRAGRGAPHRAHRQHRLPGQHRAGAAAGPHRRAAHPHRQPRARHRRALRRLRQRAGLPRGTR